MKYIIPILMLFCSLQILTPAAAQSSSGNAQKEMQQLMEQARKQMSAEDYVAANRSFRKMLSLNSVLPTEMCYYFANTLYMLGQYENSLRFVEKYQSLAGKGGEYFRESEKLMAMLKTEMETIRSCKQCDLKGYVLEDCHYCEGKGEAFQNCTKCFGRGKIKCESCHGEGVVIQKNQFGQNTYQSCTVCEEGKGVQRCYLCEGEGMLSSKCRSCGGKGREPNHELCKHPDSLPQ